MTYDPTSDSLSRSHVCRREPALQLAHRRALRAALRRLHAQTAKPSPSACSTAKPASHVTPRTFWCASITRRPSMPIGWRMNEDGTGKVTCPPMPLCSPFRPPTIAHGDLHQLRCRKGKATTHEQLVPGLRDSHCRAWWLPTMLQARSIEHARQARRVHLLCPQAQLARTDAGRALALNSPCRLGSIARDRSLGA